MEQEKTGNAVSEKELQSVGNQAAEALRGYGYPDLAQEYERALHRSVLYPKDALAHSRMVNVALKELNTLSEERQGRHLALNRNIEIQERLENTLWKVQQKDQGYPMPTLSHQGKEYLKGNSQPLVNAAHEVSHYLRDKRVYSQPETAITPLERRLDEGLDHHRQHPSTTTMAELEKHTRTGLNEMKEDFLQTKEAFRQENERYIAKRDFLSEAGKETIRREADQGIFMMPNRQRGHSVMMTIGRVEEHLNEFSQAKKQAMEMDQPNKGTFGVSRSSNSISLPELHHNENQSIQSIHPASPNQTSQRFKESRY
ncbi:hypothetical protein [Tunicatimonas pelagia]|uniref:hypothetical protein n=1 Tax=Tunicatimonas pelagia TaxID=931531 RepID=UPI002666D502|nr:hypothetical protein [Tunicatimonas pelagia]WKN42732.1 hypothetical protein P0M28_27215 [Tunicatimonas pelagia]